MLGLRTLRGGWAWHGRPYTGCWRTLRCRGGRKPDPQEGAEARRWQAEAFAARVLPVVVPLREQGLSLREIAARLTADSIATPNGGAWSADAVRRVMLRGA